MAGIKRWSLIMSSECFVKKKDDEERCSKNGVAGIIAHDYSVS